MTLDYSSELAITFGGFYSPPLMQYDKMLGWNGPLIDLAISISEYFHLDSRFCNLSAASLQDFRSSGVDVGLGVFQTPLRAKLLGSFSRPILRLALQGLGLADYAVSSIDDLYDTGHVFGVKEGDIGHEFLLEKYGKEWVRSRAYIIPAISPKDSWELLESNQCDIVLCDSLTLANNMEMIKQTSWFTFSEAITDIDLGFLVGETSPLSTSNIDSWLEEYAAGEEVYQHLLNLVSFGEYSPHIDLYPLNRA